MNDVQFATSLADWLLADPAHIVVTASLIASLTPTPDSTSLAGKLYRIVDLLALNVLRAKDSGGPGPAGLTGQPAGSTQGPIGLTGQPAGPTNAKQAGYSRLVLAALVAGVGAILGLGGCSGVQSAAVSINSQAVQAATNVGKDQLTLGKELICAVPYQTAVDAMAQDAALAGSIPGLCPAMVSVPAPVPAK